MEPPNARGDRYPLSPAETCSRAKEIRQEAQAACARSARLWAESEALRQWWQELRLRWETRPVRSG
jgi:hypothetical protein